MEASVPGQPSTAAPVRNRTAESKMEEGGSVVLSLREGGVRVLFLQDFKNTTRYRKE